MHEQQHLQNHENISDQTDRWRVEQPEVQVLFEREPRLVELFKSEASPELMESADEGKYDFLFDPDQEQYLQCMQQHAADRSPRPFARSEEAIEAASDVVAQMRNGDSGIREIIYHYRLDNDSDQKISHLLYEDNDMRYDVGRYLLDKLENDLIVRPNQYGLRIRDNTEKKPGARTLPRDDVTSREYAVLLALAKLDGTYEAAREQDTIKRDERGEPVLGQHRAAADSLLEAPGHRVL